MAKKNSGMPKEERQALLKKLEGILSEQEKSAATIKNYKFHVSSFLREIGEDYRTITARRLESYLKRQAKEKHSRSFMLQRCASLDNFLKNVAKNKAVRGVTQDFIESELPNK